MGWLQAARMPPGYDHDGADEKQSRAPVKLGNHQGGEGWYGEGAGADARYGEAGCEATSSVEPFLYGADRGHVRQSHSAPYADSEGGLHLPQRLGNAGNDQTATHQRRTAGNEHPWPQTVGEHPTQGTHAEQDQYCGRKGDRDGGAAGSEFILQRREDRSKRIRTAESHQQDEEGAGNRTPALAGFFCRISVHLDSVPMNHARRG